jgi:hypothetical protein
MKLVSTTTRKGRALDRASSPFCPDLADFLNRDLHRLFFGQLAVVSKQIIEHVPPEVPSERFLVHHSPRH